MGADPDRLYERARASTRGSRPVEAERLLEATLQALRDGPSRQGLTRERVLLTLAYVRAELGHIEDGLQILDRIETGADRHLAGVAAGQRGLVLLRAGRPDEAVEPLNTAVRLLTDPTVDAASMLLNRGLLAMTRGDWGLARRDFEQCQRVAVTAGADFLVSQARHNLGCIALFAGDLPRALRELDDAVEALRSWGGPMHVYHVDRARALFAAGLLDEAESELVEARRVLGRGGRRQDLGEVDLARAQIALAAGQPRQARAQARRAARQFAQRGSRGWALLAELAHAQGVLASPRRPDRGLGQRLREVADGLDRYGLAEDARMARLVATQAFLRLDDLAAAQGEGTPAARLRRADRIGTRLLARQVRAALATASGQPRRADIERRAGLRELHAYQASFGSLDLQTAVTVHGQALAAEGLAAAVRSGRPGEVLAWVERGRALASRLPAVVPPDDAEIAELLAGLRYVRQGLREAQLAGGDDPALRRRAVELEQAIRQRSWYLAGSGDVSRPAWLSEVRAALGERDRSAVLVAHLVVGNRTHALVVTRGGGRVVSLGEVDPLVESLRRVRADLDALAVSGYPEAIRQVVRRSLVAGLRQLDEGLWRPLGPAVGEGPVVLVPAGALAAVPWTLLPGLRGRPLTVARSASAWLRERAATADPEWLRADGPMVAASGPDLPHGRAEVTAVAALWPGARAMVAPTGEEFLAAFGRSQLVHVAAHGVHESANPLFSALRLADGPLFGYDLVRSRRMPRHVVLSACDLGQATQRPGEELLGMTAALLHAGTPSVTASVARVGDEAAHEVTLAYHAALLRHRSPAEALAEAVGTRSDAPFVCFGSGW